LTLSRTILPSDPGLYDEVRFSLEKPGEYVWTSNRVTGLPYQHVKPTRHLPWFALLNGLSLRRLLVSWDSGGEAPALRRAWVIRKGRWNAEYAWSDTDHHHRARQMFWQMAEPLLRELDYVMCEFIPSFRAPMLTVLPRETAELCSKLALESGYGILILHSREPKPSFLSESSTFYAIPRLKQ
jgi:hypothetical protein